MPDDNQKKEEDLKKDNGSASETDQSENGDKGNGEESSEPKMVQVSEEELNNLKSDLEKSNSDRDNYRQATLDKKSKERSLEKKKEDAEGENQGAPADAPDVGKVVDERLNAFQETTRKSLQSRAQRKFLGKNPDFTDDTKWNQVVGHLRLRGDEVTEEDYADRIDEAHLLYMRETGQLEEYLESERQKAKQQGAVEAQAQTGMRAGDTGDGRSGGQPKDTLTPQGIELTRKFGNDPERVKKVDVSKDHIRTADTV